MKNNVFVMAQGKGSRWTDTSGIMDLVRADIPLCHKQVIPIGDSNIISRTIDHACWLGDMYVVCGNDLIGQFPTHLIRRTITLPDPGNTLLHGIWKTSEWWSGDRIIFLLGDVVYSSQMIEIIGRDANEESSSGYELYGRVGHNPVTGKEASELFAISVSADHYQEFLEAVKSICIHQEDNGQEAKLWHLQRGLGLKVVTIPGDYTDDVDSPQEYVKFWDKLSAAAIEDDEDEKNF